ncbi:hypothetical protein [Kitasatospora sp. NPDC093558]|uniref:hypothetical protein n=1 Tax=Kitasatospora sp. NPDC093558 TaxID=3155201 RepID=UPI00342A35A2
MDETSPCSTPPPAEATPMDEIEARFTALLDGRLTREAADEWAMQQLQLDNDIDELTDWALDLLAGIDLRHGPGAPYLHDDAQISGWLDELRARRATS